MRLSIVTPKEASRRSWVAAGESFESGSAAHVADELRAMAMALGAALRTSLVRRTVSLLAPACAVDEAKVIEVCRALERRGDLLGGAGGLVGPAPLRLIEGHRERLLVVGSLPTSTLRALLPGGDVSPGVDRTTRVPIGDRPALLEKARATGARVLSAEEWAGLSRSPAADSAWLDDLAQRAANEGDSHEVDLSTRWDDVFVYEPPPPENPTRRWQRPAPSGIQSEGSATPAQARLLRARQSGGWSAYGWGVLRARGELPRPFVPLTRDEARRTEFAVDRASARPRGLRIEMENELCVLTLDMALPSAEYRFLLSLAEERREDVWPAKLCFTRDAWTRAASTLAERLGVTLLSDSMTRG